ncbi:glycosyltransferase family 2 protein [Leptodesmis sichuanensis]|uniref:glycosyltransferase family 2 protein n=1 Tax=Leptodesmis sichuanensis TaxID=2906798 RepID=UPI001F19E0BB|nr:glycosyltransferase family 2 protein [Leptodesmis sichuanensis]UIE39484.1 glycosyltransferase family 2 protein [Leptodesmis sichuanensis A121]
METVLNPSRPCSLLIIIVNYRTARLTIDCLRSLEHEVRSQPGTQVVVVDNASGDQSVDAIQAAITQHHWQDWVTLLPSSRNGGYAYGNNLAIRPTLRADNPPSYYLLLNPDTQVRPGALKALVDFMEQHPTVGIAGSSFENQEGQLWANAFRFPSVWSELDGGLRLGLVSKLLSKWVVTQPMTEQAQAVDWLPGASMMIRRQVFETIGLMDEGYFLYYEETDFCLQAKRAGWPCWYVPQSRVMHIAGQSTGVRSEDRAPKRLPQYVFDSRRRYFVKNHGWLYAALADLAWSIGYSLWSMRRVIQRKPNTDPPYLFLDSLRNSVFLKFGSY